MTFVGALRHDGIIAPWVIDGPINGESFRTYVEQVLVPELRPGDIVDVKVERSDAYDLSGTAV